MTEGYIKFKCVLRRAESPSDDIIGPLNELRNQLYDLGYIGLLPEGIGFGNVSRRTAGNKFIISASRTGAIRRTDRNHYCLVDDYDIDQNTVYCSGQTEASSETLTHAAVYESLLNIAYIAHIHNEKLWNEWLGKMPATAADAEYGTPEIAKEIAKVCKSHSADDPLIIVMAGHKDGIIIASDSAERIYDTLRNLS